MIYTIGIKSKYTEATVEDVYSYYKDKEYLSFDSETHGFDPYTKDLMCIQLGDKENQFVIHPSYIQEFKELLEEKTLVGHHIKFDLLFLYHQGIYPNKAYDTFLAEGVLYCGIQSHRKGLAVVAKNRLGIDLDKSIRDNIWKEGLTDRVIEYSADDVKYLEEIQELQQKELTQKNLHKTLDLENRFTLVLAYIEYCGFKLDKEQWKVKIKRQIGEFEKAEESLNQYILDNKLNNYIDFQGDLFNPEIKPNINWSSSRQVVKLFQELGMNITITEKGKEKESVDAKVISKYKDKFPIVPIYLTYKEYEKTISTYGESFLNQINPVTNRLHTRFKQILDTGRISSGGKNKNTGESYPNFQNIPSDKETRSCFVAEEGNTLIVADYSGQENIILANKALDKNLLEFYDSGMGDLHAFVAAKMFPELEGLSLAEIKEKHSEKRNKAKSASFAIAYGGNGDTLAGNLNITKEQGMELYTSYFKAFPGMENYFSSVKQEGIDKGFITINSIYGRKSFINFYTEFKNTEKKFTKNYWEKYREEKAKDSELYQKLKHEVSLYFRKKGEIERISMNFPVQGSGADMMKEAGIQFFSWIKQQNLINIVKMVNMVHDEYVLECPKEEAIYISKKLHKTMLQAAAPFCQRVPMNASSELSDYWTK